MSKASKQRPCPALGQTITPAACGEQRESRLKCPADCAYNPFNPANYSQLLEIENRLDLMSVKRFKAQGPVHQPEEITKAKTRDQSIVALQSYFSWNFFLARDEGHTSFAERWVTSPDSGLKNDERVLLRAKMQMRVALLEVHRFLPGGRVEAVDLLPPASAPSVLLDRRLSAVACRFSTFLAWIFPAPHYWRLSGAVLFLPDEPSLSGPEIVREIVQHLGGPTAEAEVRGWLAEHLPRFHLSLDAFSRLRRQQMLVGIDAKVGKAVYEIQAPFAICREVLEGRRDISPDELSDAERNEGLVQACVWFEDRPPAATLNLPGGQNVLGRVLLGQSHWRLETFGAEKLARLRSYFELQLGKLVRFSGERVDDLAAQIAAKEPYVDLSLVPPRLQKNSSQIILGRSRTEALPPGIRLEDAGHAMIAAADKAFLEDHIPALDGKTPREAARDLRLRPKLIHLLKQRLHSQDERNLQTGGADDLNWMLRELGLHEIIFDPPPFRPPPPGANPVDDAESEPEDFPESESLHVRVPVDLNRPPAPPLPAAPLELDEAVDRVEKAMRSFKTFPDSVNELDASGATMLDDVEELTCDILTTQDYTFIFPFLVDAWFALAPIGCRAPEIDYADFQSTYLSNLRHIEDCAQSPGPQKLESFMQSSTQPALTMVMLGEVFETINKMPNKTRPSPEAQRVIVAVLKTLVEKLSEALRPE